ncbi:hypothetical protein [Antarctobacter jejuensis]|uniref:hypothetical protein n=1 Tax=Antarctobacter jejuensis TaxID=1439938 RepID=UPI003FD0AD79
MPLKRAIAGLAVLVMASGLPFSAIAQQCPGFRVVPCVLMKVDPPQPQCSGVCEELSKQLERGCTVGTDQPYADTVFLRREGVHFGSEDMRRDLALAALAETLDGVTPLTVPLYGDPDPRARYAAALQTALTAVRAGQIGDPRFAEAITMMEAAEFDNFPRSDLLFMKALQAEAANKLAEARAFAHAAADLEPRFFNALALELRLTLLQGAHLRGAAGRFDNPETCAAEFRQLLSTLARIADLEPCPRVAAHLEMYLSRQLRVPDQAPGLRAARVYLGVLSRRESMAQSALEAFVQSPQPICAGPVVAELRDLLTLLDGAGPAGP